MEQLVTGGMPQNGNKLPDAEIMLIMKWIEQGAKFDGPDPAATLNSLVPGGNNNRNNGTPVVQATGREKISFIRDIAPLMMDNCIRCHTGQNPPGRLNMLSFSTFMRGGQSGNLIAEGNPANSLLINVLKGTAKDVRRMPDRRQPLSDEDIKKFETWITEGNKFDGDDPGQTIEFALKVAKARKMSHDELAEWRVEMANKNWATANPSNKPDVIRGKEVTVVGRLPVVKMDEATKTADDVRNKLAQALHLPLDKPLVKGKVTIFLFDKRFEYSEHARMVESRDPPSDVPAHWRYDIVDAYGCVPAPRDGDTAYPAHVAEQLAGVYIESLGRGIPRWFSVGSARMLAARIEPKSVAVKQWEDAIAPAVNTGKYDQIITARDLDGTGSALSYALVKFMSAKQNSARYTQLVEALKRGTSFDAALKQTYNTDPKKLASLCFTGK